MACKAYNSLYTQNIDKITRPLKMSGLVLNIYQERLLIIVIAAFPSWHIIIVIIIVITHTTHIITWFVVVTCFTATTYVFRNTPVELVTPSQVEVVVST